MEVSDKLHVFAALPLRKGLPGTHWINLKEGNQNDRAGESQQKYIRPDQQKLI
jgi:hypothetical protein